MNIFRQCSLIASILFMIVLMTVPASADILKDSYAFSSISNDVKLKNKLSPNDNQTLPSGESAPVFHITNVPKIGNAEHIIKNESPVDASTEYAQTTDSEQTPQADTPLNISYVSNETAVRAVDKSLTLFSDRLKKTFSVWLERSAKYVEIMQDILKEKGLPEELVFLPMIESGFNPHAYSKASAVGQWQFIASTAKRYGLVIDWWRDERKDPVKSTEAAASYLKDLYGMFGSWKLALAAYNAGEGRIGRAIKKANNDDFWHLKSEQKIPKETREYVPRYIAATMIASTPEDYGFYNLTYHEPFEYDEVTVYSPIDIDIIAKCAGTSVQEIRDLNPELRRWSTPLNISQYTIRIPSGSKEMFNENLQKIPSEKRFSMDTYKVKKGDTIKKIARSTNVPAGVILAINSMSGLQKLRAGTVINIPPKGKYFADIDDKRLAKRKTASNKKLVSRTKKAKTTVKTKKS